MHFYHSLIIAYYLLPSVGDLFAGCAIFVPVLSWFLPGIVESVGSVGVDMGTALWLTFGLILSSLFITTSGFVTPVLVRIVGLSTFGIACLLSMIVVGCFLEGFIACRCCYTV